MKKRKKEAARQESVEEKHNYPNNKYCSCPRHRLHEQLSCAAARPMKAIMRESVSQVTY